MLTEFFGIEIGNTIGIEEQWIRASQTIPNLDTVRV